MFSSLVFHRGNQLGWEKKGGGEKQISEPEMRKKQGWSISQGLTKIISVKSGCETIPLITPGFQNPCAK